MEYILLIALTFGVLFLLDKGLTKLFRSRAEHRSGTAVRLKKSVGVMSIALMIFSVLMIGAGISQKMPMLLACGGLIGPGGAVLGIYYLTHGIFYDGEGFLYTTFGNRSTGYRYADITAQKLYRVQGGSLLVELYMADGKTVPVQTSMAGAYDFLDKAAHARFRQLGAVSAECAWFDAENSCWFPPMED